MQSVYTRCKELKVRTGRENIRRQGVPYSGHPRYEGEQVMGRSRPLQQDGIRMHTLGSSRHSATNNQWGNNRSQLFRAQAKEISDEERKLYNITCVGGQVKEVFQ